MYQTISAQWEEVQVGTFLATESYGDNTIPVEFRGTDHDDAGHDDNYRGYLEAQTRQWELIDATALGTHFDASSVGRFTQGGLYRGTVEEFLGDDEQAEALLAKTTVGGQNTLVLSFRGTDALDKAIRDGSAWTAKGNKGHYEAYRPLIDALFDYAVAEGITKLVVSGHSLGGTMTDVFTLVDAKRFQDAGIELTVVALASPGVDKDLSDVYPEEIDTRFANILEGPFVDNSIHSLNKPDFYIGLNHSEDTVGRPVENPSGFLDDLIAPNGAIQTNKRFGFANILELPNLDNFDALYDIDATYPRGFGAEHHGQLYLHHIQALTSSELLPFLKLSHNIIFGLGDYASAFGIIEDRLDDLGVLSLVGTSDVDFILGLEGNDSINGGGSGDLIDGGEGRDTLFGASGSDRLSGGDGADVLEGGWGADTLIGGQGNDVFVVQNPFLNINQIDHIRDYGSAVDNNDVIDLSQIVGDLNMAGRKLDDLVRLVKLDRFGNTALQVNLTASVNPDGWHTVAYLDSINDGTAINLKLDPNTAWLDEQLVAGASPNPTTGDNWRFVEGHRHFDEIDSQQITFTIERAAGDLQETVYVSTVQIYGSINSDDYSPLFDEEITFNVGEKTKTVSITIEGDSAPEPDETYGVIVQTEKDPSPEKYVAITTFTIRDNDAPAPDSTFTEGDDWVLITGDQLHGTWNALGGYDRVSIDLSTFITDLTLSYYHTSSTDFRIYEGSSFSQIRNAEAFTLSTGSGNDRLDTSRTNGNDILRGNGGNDTLQTGAGQDALYGGAGNDHVYAGFGQDLLYGGAGDDHLDARGDGADVLDGGTGTDSAYVDRSTTTQDMAFTFDFGVTTDQTLSDGTILRSIEKLNFQSGAGDDVITYRFNPTLGISDQTSLHMGGGNDRAILDLSTFTTDLTLSYYHTSSTDFRIYEGSSFSQIRNAEAFTLSTGSGNDRLDTSRTNGNDILRGNGGNDTLQTGAGQDALYGGAGNDHVYAGFGQDLLYGGAGDDQLYAGEGNDTLSGGLGNDTVDAGNGSDLTHLGAGHDLFQDTSENGPTGSDTVFGGTGNDTVLGSGGNDQITGDKGHDSLLGGEGDDTVNGSNGNDKLYGEDGDDDLLGGGGADRLFGGIGRDLLKGGSHADILNGDEQNDTLEGGDGQDILFGGSGNDLMRGGKGADKLFGGAGLDKLFGGANSDILNGNNGNDKLDGGTGNDTLAGGNGFDRFIFTAGFGEDTIRDFSADDREKIDLSSLSGITDFNDFITNHLNDIGGIAQIQTGSNTVLLEGVAFTDVGAGQLYSADDFVF